MNPPRFPAAVHHYDDDQVALVVDCADPRCMSGLCEVIVYVAGMAAPERAAALLRASRERGLCDRHAVLSFTGLAPLHVVMGPAPYKRRA